MIINMLNSVNSTKSLPHEIAAKPPNNKKAPEKAQVMSEYISFGVMASWHFSGSAARGIMKPNYECQRV